jgi:hypothetical protein
MKKYVSPVSADQLYEFSRDAVFTTEAVQFPELRKFSLLLKSLSHQLGETAEDEFWLPLLRELKGFWYEICAAPLSGAYLKDRAHYARRALIASQHICELAYPDFVPYMQELSKQLQSLSETKLDLLLDKVKDVVRGERLNQSAIVITRSRLISLVEDAIRPLSRSIVCEVITPESLRAGACYDSLILVGPPYWFPPFVFSAPRAGRISVVRYKWLRGSPAPEAVFAAPLKHTGSRLPNFDGGETDDEADTWDALLPASGVAYLARVAANQLAAPDDDAVEARAFVLEDGEIVFLETEGASALVIDTNEKAANRVKRLETSQIEPGMFLLLRTEGGGDYILPVANRILGGYADSARQRQKRWKQLLRAAVRRNDLHAVIVELERYGCTIAREINVRHWMSERSIKTKRRIDFDAIMQLVGLKDEANDYWETMEVIDRAHKKAGFHIRELLLDLVNKSDLTMLDRRGMLPFELPDKDAGSLTAFRVKSVSPQTYTVAASRIGELLPEA